MFQAKKFEEVAKYLLSVSEKTKDHPPNTMVVKKNFFYPPSINFLVDQLMVIGLNRGLGETYNQVLRSSDGFIGMTADEPYSVIGKEVSISVINTWLQDKVKVHTTPTGVRLAININDNVSIYGLVSMTVYVYVPYPVGEITLKFLYLGPDEVDFKMGHGGLGVYHLNNGCETLIHKLNFKDYAKE